jgi:hypothetical protein
MKTGLVASVARLFAGVTLACTLSGGAGAATTFYSAGDDSSTNFGEMTASAAAGAAFDAMVPTATRIDFEAATPAGFTWSSGSVTNVPFVTGCAHRCGFNTTVGGQNYLGFGSGTITFTFASAINRFGVYVTGLQNTLVGGPTTLYFSDGSAQSTTLAPVEGGGGAFIGFSTTGAVTSLSFYTRSDIVGFDDIRYAFVDAAAVPEPATWALMIGGFGLAGMAARRRRSAVRFA